MMSSAQAIAEIAKAIRDRETVTAPQLTLADFRDLHNQLNGVDASTPVVWHIVLLGDEALIQAAGAPEVTLYLYDRRGKSYHVRDFDFVDPQHRVVAGSVEGKYRLRDFLKEVGRGPGIAAVVLGLTLATAFIDSVPVQFIAALNNALVSALSIFVSIFVLFVLAVDPDKEYRYLRSGRFHKLAQSDMFIAGFGVAALISSILGNALAAINPSPLSATRMLMAMASAAAVTLTSLSFWFVIGYHIVRKHEMTAYQMGIKYLREANPRDD